MPNQRATIAALLCLSLAIAQASEQSEISALYRRGLAGDKEAVEQCIAKLERVVQTESGNQLARVYLGSAYTLRSRDLGFGPKKLQTLRQGLAVMDAAVAAAPNEAKVRLARALTTSALPAIFGRATQSREDFAWLADQAQRDSRSFDAGELQIVFYNAGLAAKAGGDRQKVIALFEKAQRHPADPKLAEKVAAELAKGR